MKNQEALKTCALLSQFLNLVQDEVSDLLASGVVTSGTITGSILFACDELLRVEELAVGASAHLINEWGFQVYKHCPGHMLASVCLTEEGVDLAIGLKAMFQAVELPAGIACLNTSLAKVDGDALTHSCCSVAAEQLAERRRDCYLLQHYS